MMLYYICYNGNHIDADIAILKLLKCSMLYIYLVGCPYYRELKSLLNGQRVSEVCSICVVTILYSKVDG